MDIPDPVHLAHDLRNLVGIVRVTALDLADRPGIPPALKPALDDLEAQTRFAMEALCVLERWHTPAPADVLLGAWGWALRLVRRQLALEGMPGTGRTRLVVPDALAAGLHLVDALGSRGRLVRLAATSDGAIRFSASIRAEDAVGLDDALAALQRANLTAVREAGVAASFVVRGPKLSAAR